MTQKELILKTMTELPDDASIEDAMDRLYVLFKVEKGLAQIEEGQTVTHEEAKRRLSKWLR